MLEFNFHPFPVIGTERLILREITNDDTQRLFELRKDIDVMRYIDRAPHRSIEDAVEMVQKIRDGIANNNTVAWAVTLKKELRLIGTISYHYIEKENHRAEIGYMLDPKHWRRGLINEAIIEIIRYGFEVMNLHSIEANVNPNNTASSNLLKKHGFVKEAHFKENHFYDGIFSDTEIYSLLTKVTR